MCYCFKDVDSEADEQEDEEEEKAAKSKPSSTKYVPPALRKLQGKVDSEKLKIERLKKQLKGLLNRFVVF